jgi:hypothetical protein
MPRVLQPSLPGSSLDGCFWLLRTLASPLMMTRTRNQHVTIPSSKLRWVCCSCYRHYGALAALLPCCATVLSLAAPIPSSQVDGLTGSTLLRAAANAMAYMYQEEDRLVPGGARYVVGGFERPGMVMPPGYAKLSGATLDTAGCFIPTKDSRRVTMHPPRLRFATPAGPFRIGEMCIEDIGLASISFSPLESVLCQSMSPGFDHGAVAIPDSFVVAATYCA